MAPLAEISRAFGSQSQEPISRTMQYRKVTKPLLERQRRARINRCLDELKEILMTGLEAEGENVARLEKADILELTVRHLQKLTQQQSLRDSADDERHRKPIGDDDKFRSGYAKCAQEVSRVLAQTPTIDIQVGTAVMLHLGHSLNNISSPHPRISPPSPTPSQSSSSSYRPYTPPYSPQSPGSNIFFKDSTQSCWRPW